MATYTPSMMLGMGMATLWMITPFMTTSHSHMATNSPCMVLGISL